MNAPLRQIFLQSDGVVKFLVTSAKDKGHRTIPQDVRELLEDFRLAVELLIVALLELVPFFRIVVEPFSERGARGSLLEP